MSYASITSNNRAKSYIEDAIISLTDAKDKLTKTNDNIKTTEIKELLDVLISNGGVLQRNIALLNTEIANKMEEEAKKEVEDDN